MIEKLLPLEALQGERHFRWRGGNASRLEALTDSVFALAMTLLIVRTDVPNDYGELVATFQQLPAFAACFSLFVLLWYYHFQFHRRFGLENLYTIFLNICLLFLILVYVYPAKFIFSALADAMLWNKDAAFPGSLMYFYSGGIVGIFLLFPLMYVHAYKHRHVLGLDEVEVHITREAIREHLIHTGVGLLSLLITFLGSGALAGLIYVLVGPLQALNGWLSGRSLRAKYGV